MDPAGRARAREQSQPEFQQHWRVERGELVNDGEGSYATTDEEFGDIELRLEYRTVAKADSGIYLRGNPQVPDLGHDRSRRQVGPRRAVRIRWPLQQRSGRART